MLEPAYPDAVCTVCDILMSDEYEALSDRLRGNVWLLRQGLLKLGLVLQGGRTPIVSVLVGDEGDTLRAGAFLFDQGYLRAVGGVPGRALPHRHYPP